MDREEIRKKIFKVLNINHQGGLRTEDLRREIGIDNPKSTDARKFYRELSQLTEEEKIIYNNKIKVYYIIQHETKVWEKWKLYDPDLIKDAVNIVCGFVLIEKGVISKTKGILKPFGGDYPFWSNNVVLNELIGIEDDTDYLFLSIENCNKYPIEGIKVRVELPRIFYEIGEFIIQKNCECDKERYTIFVKCKPLMYKQRISLAIQLQPTKHNVSFKNKEIEDRYRKEECVPNVKCWYNKVPIKVRGGKVTLDSTKGVPIDLVQDEILIFQFDV